MKLPPLLLGTVLAFWGWHVGLWWLGLPLGLLAELPRSLAWRWELGVRERQRVADLCTLLVFLAGLYLYFTQPRLGSAIIVLLQWFPVLLFPLLAAQLYGGRDGVELSVLFLSLRGGRPGGEGLVDLHPAYLLICLLAAAMVPPGGRFYLPALALLAAWTLWPLRPRRHRVWLWGFLLALAVGVSYGLGQGLQRVQNQVGDLVVEWLSGWMDGSLDPYRASTAIGDVGRLKLSERIVLRVRPDRPLQEPLLLRSASYNRYIQGNWLARHLPFEPLTQGPGGWRLAEGGTAPHRVGVEMELDDGRGVLPLPGGGRLLQGLKGAQLSRNPYGAVKVLEGPALADYRVSFDAGFTDAAPEEADLRVLPEQQAFTAPLVQALGLQASAPGEALIRLQALFARDFAYSLRLEAPPRGRGALEHFLLHRRAGHCEYFASAGVLLLRQAGIPARYARGWSVQEYSELEQAYVVRARHAHAWVLAWVDGAWRDFDPTPPDWGWLEAQGRPWWGGVQDLLGWISYTLSYGEGLGEETRTRLLWLLLPLVALLGWRITRRGSRRARSGGAAAKAAGRDSPFIPVEGVLARRGRPRRSGETLREWVGRLEREGEPAGAELRPAVELHYRRCFDPAGLTPEEGGRLGTLLREFLRRYR